MGWLSLINWRVERCAMLTSGPLFISEKTELFALKRSYLAYIEKVEGLAVATVKNRRYILRDFMRHLQGQHITCISSVDIEVIDNYILSRSDLKQSSLGLVKQAIKHFLWYCQYRQKINLGFDYTLIRRQKVASPRVQTYTPEQIANVLKLCGNHQDKLMIATLFETGMRIGELVKLSIEDIRGTEIRIRGKGSKDRVAYVTNELASALRTHAVKTRVYYGAIFRHQMKFSDRIDDSYATCTVRDRIQRQFAKSGISQMHPHELRHSFAIEWLTKGGDVRTLQKILGHSSLEITMRYLQTTDNFTQQAYEKTITKSVL
jgi:site-specific recombinase XerD